MKFGAPGAALTMPAMVSNILLTTRIIDLRLFTFVSFLIAAFYKAADCGVFRQNRR